MTPAPPRYARFRPPAHPLTSAAIERRRVQLRDPLRRTRAQRRDATFGRHEGGVSIPRVRAVRLLPVPERPHPLLHLGFECRLEPVERVRIDPLALNRIAAHHRFV